MEPAAGLTPLAFTAPQRAARRERLREDLGRKDRLDPRSRAALEGLAHAAGLDAGAVVERMIDGVEHRRSYSLDSCLSTAILSYLHPAAIASTASASRTVALSGRA